MRHPYIINQTRIMNRWTLFALLLVVFSCKKDPKPPAPHQNSYSARVNGVPFIFSEIIAEKTPGPAGVTSFYLAAKDAGNRYIIFLIHDYRSSPISALIDSAGTKALATFSEGLGLYNLRLGISGNAGISTVDRTKYTDGEVVSGSFDFVTEPGLVLPGPYTITEGKFSVFLKK
jgi:hypothetical protein